MSHSEWWRGPRKRRQYVVSRHKAQDKRRRRDDAIQTAAMLLGARYLPLYQKFVLPDGSVKSLDEVLPDL